MRIEWRLLGDLLVSAGARCRSEAILVAPFMKAQTLERIVAEMPATVSLLCLTRWRLEEIGIGVSDIECWDIISARENSRLQLRSNLHAKYFRFDDVVYLGSANLTLTALGWSARPNAEALAEFRAGDIESVINFEKDLLSDTVPVTSDLVADFKNMLKAYSEIKPEHSPLAVQEVAVAKGNGSTFEGTWLPRSRSPEFLYHVYRGEDGMVSKVGRADALCDLLELDLPYGLSERTFRELVGSRLASAAIVISLNQFLSTRRRFGEIRSWLVTKVVNSEGTDEWQRLMRWLLYFLPSGYEATTANYSEIFGKLTRDQG